MYKPPLSTWATSKKFLSWVMDVFDKQFLLLAGCRRTIEDQTPPLRRTVGVLLVANFNRMTEYGKDFIALPSHVQQVFFFRLPRSSMVEGHNPNRTEGQASGSFSGRGRRRISIPPRAGPQI